MAAGEFVAANEPKRRANKDEMVGDYIPFTVSKKFKREGSRAGGAGSSLL
jgi:hypothetical protein